MRYAVPILGRAVRRPQSPHLYVTLSRNCLRREPHGQAAAGAQTGLVLGPIGHPVPLLRNVAATGWLGFERHGRGPSVREGALVLHRPALDANRPIRATSVDAPFRAREN